MIRQLPRNQFRMVRCKDKMLTVDLCLLCVHHALLSVSFSCVRWMEREKKLSMHRFDGSGHCIGRARIASNALHVWNGGHNKHPNGWMWNRFYSHTNKIKCDAFDTLRFQAKWKDALLFARSFRLCVSLHRTLAAHWSELLFRLKELTVHRSIHQFRSSELLRRPIALFGRASSCVRADGAQCTFMRIPCEQSHFGGYRCLDCCGPSLVHFWG